MTMAVELRMTAITGILELRSGLNPSGQQSRCNHLHSRALYACIPGAAECDFDVCKNVLCSILCLRATSGGQLNANRL